MHNASTPSTLTSTLIFVRACVRNLNAGSLTDEQIALLHEIANFACANAQEARYVQASEEAAVERLEEQEDLAWESDAMDHSCEGGEDRHLDGYWESLTDVGDMGGGDW